MSNGLQTEHGVIAFFDILGYTTFLENNSPRDAAQIVVDVLLRAREEVPALIRDEFVRIDHVKVDHDFEQDMAAVRWLIFSDTILLTMPYAALPPGAVTKANAWRWILFLIHVQLVHSHLFRRGLPIRGAIACGEYSVQENCFVGRSIVDAYRLAQTINLSAVVLTSAAAAELDRVASPDYPVSVRVFTRDYDSPDAGWNRASASSRWRDESPPRHTRSSPIRIR